MEAYDCFERPLIKHNYFVYSLNLFRVRLACLHAVGDRNKLRVFYVSNYPFG